ncbi:MAG: hypothetical protein QM723_36400 [Myxococcaceae bacterium]
MTVTLRNNAVLSRLGHGVLPCTAWLERQQGDGWKPVPAGEEACIALLELLSPSSHEGFGFQLPFEAEPGRYRVCTRVSDEGPGWLRASRDQQLCTDDFDVTARIR